MKSTIAARSKTASLVIACIVASLLLDHGLMTEKLARRGLRVPSSYEPDVLQTTTVRQAMTTPVTLLPHDATVGDARRMLARNGFDPETCSSSVRAWMAVRGDGTDGDAEE